MTDRALELQALALKGAVSEMPFIEREKIAECKAKFDALVKEYGDAGLIALAMIGMEMAK